MEVEKEVEMKPIKQDSSAIKVEEKEKQKK